MCAHQLYISFKPLDSNSLPLNIEQIQACYSEIKHWMTVNLLKLNGDKTELLIATNKHLKNVSTIDSIDIDSVQINPSESIRNLGAHFNIFMDFVTKKCQSARYALRNISRVRSSLTRTACEMLVQAHVTSRLDYCNALLYGLPKYLIEKLQKVQNYAARVITMTPKRDDITPVLASLHWLPIEQRIEFKTLLYTFKALNDQAPPYLCELVKRRHHTRTLRPADRLELPVIKYSAYGGRTFERAASELWNSIEDKLNIKNAPSVDVFKKRLKTYLFRKAYF